MYKVVFPIILVLFGLVSPVIGQELPAQQPVSQEVLSSPNKVDGLELPPNQTVRADEGFVTIDAKSEGPVKWLVISNSKVKYITLDKSLVVSIPPDGGQINVFAISWVDGKFTEYARHTVTIQGGNTPVNPVQPDDPVDPVNPPQGGALHITFLVDLEQMTPSLAAIMNSQAFRQWVTKNGDYFRYYDQNSEVVKQRKLNTVVQRVGGSAVMVIQNSNGVVVQAVRVPETEAEVRAIINAAKGIR